MTSHVRLIIAEVEAAPGELGQLVQQLTAALPVRAEPRALPGPTVEAAKVLPAAVLDEHTAVCEACGCTWDEPCPEGCGWNPEAWAQGHAICTACRPSALEHQVLAVRESPTRRRRTGSRRPKAPRSGAKATVRRRRAANRAGNGPGSRLSDAEWADVRRRLAAGEGATAIARLATYRGRITNGGIRIRAKKDGWARPTRGSKGRKATPAPGAPTAADGKPAFRCASCGQRTHTNPCEHCFERF